MNSRVSEGETKKMEGGREGLALRARPSAVRGSAKKPKSYKKKPVAGIN